MLGIDTIALIFFCGLGIQKAFELNKKGWTEPKVQVVAPATGIQLPKEMSK